MKRLSDAEFIEKARASARRRSERQRLRKLNSGKVQANFWLPTDAKTRVEQLATELNTSPSEVATVAILAYRQPLAALAAPSLPETLSPPVEATPAPESLPLFEPASTERGPADTGSFNQDLAAFKTAVIDAWNGGMKGYGPIATALNNAGYRNGNGNPYPRSHVKAVLVKAGLVVETGKAET